MFPQGEGQTPCRDACCDRRAACRTRRP